MPTYQIDTNYNKDFDNISMTDVIADYLKTITADFLVFLDKVADRNIITPLRLNTELTEYQFNEQVTAVIAKMKTLGDHTHVLYLETLLEIHIYFKNLHAVINENVDGDFEAEFHQLENVKAAFADFQNLAMYTFAFQQQVAMIDHYIQYKTKDIDFIKTLTEHNKTLILYQDAILETSDLLLDKLTSNVTLSIPQKIFSAMSAFAYGAVGLAIGIVIGLPMGITMAIRMRDKGIAQKGLAAPFTMTKEAAEMGYNKAKLRVKSAHLKSELGKEQQSIFGNVGKFHEHVKEKTTQTKTDMTKMVKIASKKK